MQTCYCKTIDQLDIHKYVYKINEMNVSFVLWNEINPCSFFTLGGQLLTCLVTNMKLLDHFRKHREWKSAVINSFRCGSFKCNFAFATWKSQDGCQKLSTSIHEVHCWRLIKPFANSYLRVPSFSHLLTFNSAFFFNQRAYI